MMKRQTDLERRRGVGVGLEAELEIHVEALGQIGLSSRGKAFWLSRLCSIYCRYGQGGNAGLAARELAKLPLRCRFDYDYVVIRDLVLEVGQYEDAIDYVRASIGRRRSTLAPVAEGRALEDLLVLRTVGMIGLAGPESEEGRRLIEEIVDYYSWSPRLGPFLNLLQESEAPILNTGGADWALNHVWDLVKLAIKHGDESRKQDLSMVEASIRRLAKKNERL